MDQDNSSNPYDKYTDDDLAGIIGTMQELGRHSGYRLLMAALQEQHDELLGRLIRTNDNQDFARTQGAIRAIADILEIPRLLTPNECLRLRIIAGAEYEIGSRKEEKLDG